MATGVLPFATTAYVNISIMYTINYKILCRFRKGGKVSYFPSKGKGLVCKRRVLFFVFFLV